jgi:hypothetical protein
MKIYIWGIPSLATTWGIPSRATSPPGQTHRPWKDHQSQTTLQPLEPFAEVNGHFLGRDPE